MMDVWAAALVECLHRVRVAPDDGKKKKFSGRFFNLSPLHCKSPSRLEAELAAAFSPSLFPKAMRQVRSYSASRVEWTSQQGADVFGMVLAALEKMGDKKIYVELLPRGGVKYVHSDVVLVVQPDMLHHGTTATFTCYSADGSDRPEPLISAIAAASLARDVSANFRSYSYSFGGQEGSPFAEMDSLLGSFFGDNGGGMEMVPRQSDMRDKISSSKSAGNTVVSELESMGVQVVLPEDFEKSENIWGNLAGYEKVKLEVEESVILALKHPSLFEQIIAKTRANKAGTNRPKVVLFQGPPGTGKTSTCKIIARETSVPMIHVPLESIVSKWFGESEKQIARIYELAKEIARENNKSGVILFIDEIDSLVASRDLGSPHEASKRILSVLLRHIDGFDDGGKKIKDSCSQQEVVPIQTMLICATNRPQDLDPAFISRVDSSIEFPLPDKDSRIKIFQFYAKHLDKSDIARLAESTAGLSGRNIKDLCQASERHWAAELIRGGGGINETDVPAPPARIYLEEARKKVHQQGFIKKPDS